MKHKKSKDRFEIVFFLVVMVCFTANVSIAALINDAGYHNIAKWVLPLGLIGIVLISTFVDIWHNKKMRRKKK